MNVWDHLGELRRRLLICLYALGLFTAAGAFLVDRTIAWLSKPIGGTLVFIQPMEAFTAQVKVAVGISFLICLPVLLYQAWAFVSIGLKKNEKRYLLWAVPASY